MNKRLKAFLIFTPLLVGSFGGVLYDALNGAYILVPGENPPSIREGSVGQARHGGRTRFFVGGGLRGGK